MAVMRGCDGKITVGTNDVAYIDSFSLSMNVGSAEVSSLGNEWKAFVATSKDWSGSASGTLDYTDAAQKKFMDDFIATGSASATAKFKVASDLTLSGSINMTSLSINASHGDKVSVSFNFQGTGALAKESA